MALEMYGVSGVIHNLEGMAFREYAVVLAERKRLTAKQLRRELESLQKAATKLLDLLTDVDPMIENRLHFDGANVSNQKQQLELLVGALAKYPEPQDKAGAKTGDLGILVLGIARILHENGKRIERYGTVGFTEICSVIFQAIGQPSSAVRQSIDNAWDDIEDLLEGRDVQSEL